MKFDKPTLAILMGAFATIPYEIFTRILVNLGVAKYSVYQLSSLMITLNRPNTLLGTITSIILGGTISLVFYSVIKILGRDHLIIKSIAISLFSWLVLEVFFMWLIEGRDLIPHRPIQDYYSELFGAIIFGITLGLLFHNYLFKDNIKN